MNRNFALVAAAVLAIAVFTSAQSQTGRTVWDGVYTGEQARRGEQVYKNECTYCHRDDLSGGFFDGGAGQAPALAGPRSFGSSLGERWNGATVGELVASIASTMPQEKPASLTLQHYVDVVSYLFEKNDIPAGRWELPADVEELGRLLITVASPALPALPAPPALGKQSPLPRQGQRSLWTARRTRRTCRCVVSPPSWLDESTRQRDQAPIAPVCSRTPAQTSDQIRLGRIEGRRVGERETPLDLRPRRPPSTC